MSPCFLSIEYNCNFWLPFGWFLVAGILGVLFLISCFCVGMCVYTCHDGGDMLYD